MKGETFVFFGIVGSGKGTQVQLLTNYLKNKDDKEVVYIGTGEIFRSIMASDDSDPLTQLVKELVLAGKLIPDKETNELVLRATNEKVSPDKTVIYDGYPRTVPQSEVFANLMQEHGRENIHIIYIELSEAEAMQRNLLRGRADDTEEGLKKRFEEYRTNVIPAMNYFKDKENYTIHTINGEQPMQDVHKDILRNLHI